MLSVGIVSVGGCVLGVRLVRSPAASYRRDSVEMAPLTTHFPALEGASDGIWYGVSILMAFVVVSTVLILCACGGKKKEDEKEKAAPVDEQPKSKIEAPGGTADQSPILAVSGRDHSVKTGQSATSKTSSSLSGKLSAIKSTPLPVVKSFRLESKSRKGGVGGSLRTKSLRSQRSNRLDGSNRAKAGDASGKAKPKESSGKAKPEGSSNKAKQDGSIKESSIKAKK